MVGNSNRIDAALESRVRSLRRWHRVVPAVGVLVVLGSIGKSLHTMGTSGNALEAVLDLLLIGSLGVAIVYSWHWLPNSDVPPRLYPRIVTRVLGGIAVMAVVFGLRVLHPGVTVQFTFGTQAVLLTIGTIAGLAIGVYEARTLVQAELLAEQNEELRRAETRLEEAIDDLEASNERLEGFASAASHDLQEPLRMVTSYLELVEQRYGDDLDAEGREFIAFAVGGADRMKAMVDGLLEFSRVDAQGDPFEPVDLDGVLDDVCTDLQLRIEETDAEITREPLPTVDGDERQLQQLLQNLVSNAIDYSGDDPPRIHVGATREGAERTISVHDEGVGIDADDAERVFDLFQRLHSSEEQAGSGIGLALCQRIVDRHDGEIRVDSEPGEGSTFSVTMPAAAPSNATATVVQQAEANGTR